jgi:hypothetical protein
MDRKELYADAFMIVWEHIEEMGGFTQDEREAGYEPLKAKIYELMEAGEKDPMKLAPNALAWFRDRAQIDRSAERVLSGNKK